MCCFFPLTGVSIPGHCGHETVEYTVERLPAFIRSSLQSCLRNAYTSTGSPPRPQAISQMLRDCITQFDDQIKTDFISLFPGGPSSLPRIHPAQLKAVVNDPRNEKKALRCLQGSTVLITLVDPTRENLWVVNLGDCAAGKYAVSDSDSLLP